MSLTNFTTLDGIAPNSEWRTISYFRPGDSYFVIFLMHNGNDRIKIHYILTGQFELWITCKDENDKMSAYAYRMYNFLSKHIGKKTRELYIRKCAKQRRNIAKQILITIFSQMHGKWWDFDYLREDKAKDIEYAMDMFDGLFIPKAKILCKNCGHEIEEIYGRIMHRYEQRMVGMCSARKDYKDCGCFKPERM